MAAAAAARTAAGGNDGSWQHTSSSGYAAAAAVDGGGPVGGRKKNKKDDLGFWGWTDMGSGIPGRENEQGDERAGTGLQRQGLRLPAASLEFVVHCGLHIPS